MPPKTKKKRASLKLDPTSGQIKPAESLGELDVDDKESSVRQVVEVVADSPVPEAIETIKKDAEEIEEAVEAIEEEVREEDEHTDIPDAEKAPVTHEEVAVEEPKGNVESIFMKSESGVNPEITVVGKRGPSLGVWVGAMLGVALAIGISLIFLVRGPSTLPFFGAKPTPTSTPTVAPTPSPIAVSRSNITVSVVNGGGTPGAGSKMKTYLEGKGYTVVSVGNAKEYSYEQTEIIVKTGKENVAKLLTDDLKIDYTLGTSSATLESSVAYEAQVIVGKQE